ncbi:CD99 antigen-like protein 2 isoform X1 [Siniperca chuatsi]|uniref:CD99 antigen-like protein 2 isoform X1 n=1 Tax=Siniperca chuatsi TaxID=119488 RepID=UPI001CE03DCE|nr:CD99 antigen-like protein 2 isoform X1 [Siniperca chuatsi]XP_044039448.1 CD99 antigen-like protein 2 isoform X1 [Siniperca chuatsi]
MGSNLSMLEARVCWFGWGGLQLKGLVTFIFLVPARRAAPDVLIIHCGGNGMGEVSSVKLVIMMEDLLQLHLQHPGMKIMFLSVTRPGNLSTVLHSLNGVMIEHPLSWWVTKPPRSLYVSVYLSFLVCSGCPLSVVVCVLAGSPISRLQLITGTPVLHHHLLQQFIYWAHPRFQRQIILRTSVRVHVTAPAALRLCSVGSSGRPRVTPDSAFILVNNYLHNKNRHVHPAVFCEFQDLGPRSSEQARLTVKAAGSQQHPVLATAGSQPHPVLAAAGSQQPLAPVAAGSQQPLAPVAAGSQQPLAPVAAGSQQPLAPTPAPGPAAPQQPLAPKPAPGPAAPQQPLAPKSAPGPAASQQPLVLKPAPNPAARRRLPVLQPYSSLLWSLLRCSSSLFPSPAAPSPAPVPAESQQLLGPEPAPSSAVQSPALHPEVQSPVPGPATQPPAPCPEAQPHLRHALMPRRFQVQPPRRWLPALSPRHPALMFRCRQLHALVSSRRLPVLTSRCQSSAPLYRH